MLYKRSVDWFLGIAQAPEIPPNHAVLDFELEGEILRSKSMREAMAAAKRHDAATEDGSVVIGYLVPRGYVIVDGDTFKERTDTVLEKLNQLSSQGGLLKGWRRKKTKGADDA